ncbi:hypothetical protein [Acinetobacter baumannii]|uniref:Uncharacterized protein n=1 Tax=Acinetobacter baumannii 1499986 TaxID=1310673 RepID=A0A836YN00_ACIBA|nr:hypothetical protein [Acinetobacter baumannii]EXC37571.1 hypothetical protein J552_2822 [Acinetobacter baumannii 951631]EXG10571.1 hypothetical protein J712_2409 [Acinetobacter baumannii 722310]EXI01445.1 hypothetical protein J618_1451 [Acinetobacter baumannii 607805]EXI04899.1 hypothetical protein J639_1591 [Acinetobacter baumannii 457946]EXQ92619.1 hypothetical protein J681_1538 [Acinetobacter baumannii 1170863]
MFDKNFKIKVSGNWCEYQPNKHIDLREIISFECWADQLGNPYRFHLKNGSYHYIERYEVGKQIENVLKEQQAKVEELQKQLNEYIFVAETLDEMYVKEVKSSDELQKRVGALEKAEFTLARIRSIVSKNLLESILIREVRQALKGEGTPKKIPDIYGRCDFKPEPLKTSEDEE